MNLKFQFLNRMFSIVLCVALMITGFPQTVYAVDNEQGGQYNATASVGGDEEPSTSVSENDALTETVSGDEEPSTSVSENDALTETVGGDEELSTFVSENDALTETVGGDEELSTSSGGNDVSGAGVLDNVMVKDMMSVAAASDTESYSENYNLNFVVGVDGDFGSWLKDKMNNYPRAKITFSSFRPGTEKFWKMEGGEYALLSSANFSNATAGKYIVKKEYYTGAGKLCAISTAALNVKWLNRIQFVRTGMYEGTFGVDVISMSGVTTSNVTTYDVEYDTTRFIKFTPVVPDGYYVKSVTVNDNSYTIETTEGTGIYTLAPQTGNLGNITISPTITIEYAVKEGATIEGPAAPTLADGDTDQKQQTFTLPSDLRWAESLEITATGGVNNSINKTQKFTNITAGSTITMTLDDEIVRGPVTYSFKYGSSQVNYKSVPTKNRTYWQTLSEPSLSVNTFEYTGKPIKPVDKLTGVEAGTYTVAYLSMLTMVIEGNTGYVRAEAVGDFTKLTTDNDIEYWFIQGLGSKITGYDCPYVIQVNADESQYYKGSYDLLYTVVPRSLTVKAKNQEVIYGNSAQSGKDYVEVTGGSLLDGHSISAAAITETDNVLSVTEGSVTIQDTSGTNMNKYYTISYATGATTSVPATPDLGKVSQTGIIYDSTELSDVKLSAQKTSVAGTLELKEGQTLTVGTNDYIWVFTPDDNVNYKTATGTVSLEVTKDRVEELQTGGTLVKSEYVYGDEFSIEGLTVTAVYTSGRTEDVTSLVEYDTSLTIDKTCVTLSYQEEGSEVQTCTVDITVGKKLLTIGAYVKDREYDGTKVVDIEKVFLEGIVGEDEVSVDTEGLTGKLESPMYNYTTADYSHYPDGYKQVYLEDLTLSGADKDNYVLPQDGYVDITDEDGNAGAMFITKRTLTVKVLDQTIVEGKKLNSTKYEVEGLLPGHVLYNVTLVAVNEDGDELDSSDYTVGLEATITIKDFYFYVKVMEEGTPYIATSYYDMIHVEPEPGTLKVVASCETHDFENGFCSVCDTYEEPTLKDGIYQIDNAGKLFWFAAVVNENYPVTENNTSISAVLTEDIVVTLDSEVNKRVWIPIGGVNGVEYSGTFDGDFHTISGLYNSGEMQYLGLVGDNSGTVKNVGVINSYFSSSVDSARVGGVVGRNYGTVSGCWFTGTVETSKYDAALGGVVGYNGFNWVVENCYNAGTVTSSYDGADEVRVGGVVGWNWVATVKNCYNVGTVSSAGTGGTNKNMVGSIVGYNYGSSTYGTATVKNCYSQSDGLNCIGYNGYAYSYIVEENIENYRDFVSGEVTYLLNGSSSAGVWKQNLGVDQYPVLTGTAVVYQVKNCADVDVYSNENEDLDHVSGDDGICTGCDAKLTCYITFNGINVSSNGAESVATGNEYSAILTVAEGYDLPEEITVTIGGSGYENFTYTVADGKLTIPAAGVTDDIVITAEGVLHVHEPDEYYNCSCGISLVAAVYTDAADDEAEYFTTLTSAIEAVKSSTSADTTVRLLQNVDLGSEHLTIKAGVFSLDLNGKTLSSSDDKTIYMNGSGVELTVKDNGTGGKLDNAGILINTGTLNVSSGIVSVITIQGGEVNIEAGTIGTVKGKYGEITIAGGTINGVEKAVYVEGGTVNITGGTISGAGVYAVGGEVNITGGTITGDNTDVTCDGAAVTFGIDENSVGAVFPGGITIAGTGAYANLNGYLADDASYWMATVQKIPADADTAITDGDVQVKQKAVYTVSFTGTNVSTDGAATALKDCEYKAVLTVEEGYQLPESITVEIGGTAVTGYTYENGILTIPGSLITDNIKITAVGVLKTYMVSITDGEGNPSVRVTLSGSESVQHGQQYQVTLNNNVGSDIVLENVKAAGVDISKSVTFDENSHLLTIPAELVTGDIVISAEPTVVITINGNDGTCTNAYFAGETEVKITGIIYGKAYSVEQLQFEKTGYTCTGINTQADGNGTAYALDAELIATEDTELFMQWQVNEYKLTWILDGEEKEPVNVTYGEALPELEDAEKEGYTFVKWTGDTVPATMPDEDITIELTSEWNVNIYTISYYDSKDAEEPLSSESIAYGDEMPDVSFMPEDGYEFLYWALADGTEYAIPETMPAMDLKLYATIQPKTYALTFVDGNTTWTKMQYNEAVYQKVGEVKPKTQKKGYTFEGWFDEDENKYDENYIMPAHDVIFKAKWTIKPDAITLNNKVLNLQIGETKALIATVKPDDAENKEVTWNSSDTGIVTVDEQGNVTAVAVGSAEITATTHNGKTAKCTVNVYDYSLNLSEVTLELSKMETVTLTVSDGINAVSMVTWSSDDNSVATVNKNGVVTPKSAGVAHISAAIKNGPTLECTVTVENNVLNAINLKDKELVLHIGDTAAMKLYYTPSDTTVSKDITWLSSAPEVASVVDGMVTAHSKGTAQITASIAGLTASCEVVVKETMNVEEIEIPTLTAITNTQTKLSDVKLPTAQWKWLDDSIALTPFAGMQMKEFAAIYTEDEYTEPVTVSVPVELTTIKKLTVQTESKKLLAGQSTAASLAWEVFGNAVDMSTFEDAAVWTSSKPAVAEVVQTEAGVEIKALAKGSAKISVKTTIGGKVFSAQCSVSVVEGEASVITVDSVDKFTQDTENTMHYSADLSVAESVLNITATNTKKLTVKSGTPGVVKVGEAVADGEKYTVPLTVMSVGVAKITITANDPLKTSQEIYLYVTDETLNLSTTSITVNSLKTEGEIFYIYPNKGYALEGVVQLTGTDADKFVLSKETEENAYSIMAKDATVDGKYTVSVKVGDKECANALKVQVITEEPKITITQTKKVNLFYTKDSGYADGVLTVTTSEVLEAISLEECANFTLSGEVVSMISPKTDGLTKQCDKSGKLVIKLAGYKPIKKKISITVEDKKPSLSLSTQTASLYPELGIESANVSILEKNGKVNYGMSLDNVSVSLKNADGYSVEKSGDSIVITRTDTTKNKKVKMKLVLTSDAWSEPIELAYTVKVNTKKPAIKLDNKQVHLNMNSDVAAYDQAVATVSWKDATEALDIEHISVSGANVTADEVINKGIVFTFDGTTVIAKLNDTSWVKKGTTYKFNVQVKTTGGYIATTPLNVKVENVVEKNAVKVTTKGTIDVFKRDLTNVACTPVLKSVNGEILDVKLTGVSAHLFYAVYDNGKVFIYADPDAALISKYKYSVNLEFTLQNAEGESFTVTTSPVTLELKQSKPKVTVAPTEGIIYSGAGNSIQMDISAVLSNRKIAIEDVQLNNNKNLFELNYSDGKLTLSGNRNFVKGKTYTLKLKVSLEGRADNEKDIIINCKVKVK